MSGKNQYIGGVESYHDSSKEDRRWKFTCCSAPSQATRDCQLTGYVNNPHGNMEYKQMMVKLSLEYLAIIILENSKSYFVHAEYIINH